MADSDKWFTQNRKWARPLVKNWKGAAAGLVFVAAFFGLVVFFISLEPFQPPNYWLLGLWWLSILALMAGYSWVARSRTERRWETRTGADEKR